MGDGSEAEADEAVAPSGPGFAEAPAVFVRPLAERTGLQPLQVLRDRELIVFEGRGRYRLARWD